MRNFRIIITQGVKGTIYCLLLLSQITISAQGISISENNTTPHGSALLDMQSTEQGFLVPRMLFDEKMAITNPAHGLLIYQTDGALGFYFFDGIEWVPINDAKSAFQDMFKYGQDGPTIEEYNLSNSLFGEFSFDSTGYIYDDGGLDMNYANNFEGEITLYPADFFGDHIGLRIQLHKLRIHESDTLIISIQNGAFDFQEYKFSNDVDSLMLPLASSAAVIKFKSDGANNDEGFEIRFDWIYLEQSPEGGSDNNVGWFFDPSKAAMRGGVNFINGWKKDSLGRSSFSYGQNLKVTGVESVAFGEDNEVRGAYSGTVGKNNRIEQFGAFAYGAGNTITGHNAFAGGFSSKATGSSTVALGSAEAHGHHSIAMGRGIANGQHAVAFGESEANGLHSFATGEDNIADADGSVAFGLNNSAEGFTSFVAGAYNQARSGYETVFGLYNKNIEPLSPNGVNDEDPLFVVGNGTFSTRHNALTILKNGRMGIGTHEPNYPIHVKVDDGFGNISMAHFENTATAKSSIELVNDDEIPFRIEYDSENEKVQFYRDTRPFTIDWSTDPFGRVGIGTASPTAKLHVAGDVVVNGQIKLEQAIIADDLNGIALKTDDNVTRLQMMDDGRIGIGTTNPDAQLAVTAIGAHDALRIRTAGGTRFRVFNNGHVRIGQNAGSTSSTLNINSLATIDPLRAQVNGATAFMIHDNGGVSVGSSTAPQSNGIRVSGSYAAKSGGGSWTATSDIRLKTVDGKYEDGLSEILKIRPVKYRYNAKSGYDTNESHIGVVAQELEKVAPYMVDKFDQEGEEYLSVDNSAMIYMLINAVQEQQKMIEALQNELNKRDE